MSATDSSDLTLAYRQPAEEWTQALPIGNGRLGAMVFGAVQCERWQLNEETLWAGGPHDPVNPSARDAIEQVRSLLAQGKFTEATDVANESVMAVPLNQAAYLCLGNLHLDFGDLPQPTDYRRSLDLRTALTQTSFGAGEATHRRRVIASPTHQVIAGCLETDQPCALDVTVCMDSPLQHWQTLASGAELTFTARNDDHAHIPGALDAVARVRIEASGGTVTAQEDSVVVTGADEVRILIAAATTYVGPDDLTGDPHAKTRAWIDAAAQIPFDQLAADTAAAHQELFNGFELDLGPAPIDIPTDERIVRGQTEADPALAALYLQYARYLLICSSRPGCQPVNLQGIWNDSVKPPWGSKYTVNINTEMNYWPAQITGLGQCTEPLERLIREVAVTGARTAAQMYGARGWVLHHNTELWRSTAPIDGASHGLWPTGGAWLCTHLWENYLYNGDDDYLASVYPLLRGACEFFLDTLQHDETSGYLLTSPSSSPENKHAAGTALAAGPAMDSQILRDLFDQTATAAGILGRDADFAEELAATRAKLPPDRIGAQGQLQEWLQDWDADVIEPHHRHTSHLYALAPSRQISVAKTPELAAGARRTLELRGDESTGWATAWRISLWARLRDAEHAYKILQMLLSPGLTYPNMFDAHPPFQIDGNFGGAAGIVEMLVQHEDQHIELLPALPAAWPSGSVSGVRLPGGLELAMTWSQGKVVAASLAAQRDCPRTVNLNGQPHQVNLAAGDRIDLPVS